MTVPVMYGRTALTGGGTGALDAIDGTGLVEGDMCTVVTSLYQRTYYLNATSGASESSPNIIAPDTNAGNKRWILVATSGQPAFLVRPTSAQENIAVGSAVTVVWGTEIFDNGGNFTSNVFTAPVTGKYLLNTAVYMNDIDTVSSYYQIRIYTSNRLYYNLFDPRGASADFAYYTMTLSVVADMDIGDTAYVDYFQESGTAQTDILTSSHFSGCLIC